MYKNAETGSYEWLTGRPMDYTDLVTKRGSLPCLHLTPYIYYMGICFNIL